MTELAVRISGIPWHQDAHPDDKRQTGEYDVYGRDGSPICSGRYRICGIQPEKSVGDEERRDEVPGR